MTVFQILQIRSIYLVWCFKRQFTSFLNVNFYGNVFDDFFLFLHFSFIKKIFFVITIWKSFLQKNLHWRNIRSVFFLLMKNISKVNHHIENFKALRWFSNVGLRALIVFHIFISPSSHNIRKNVKRRSLWRFCVVKLYGSTIISLKLLVSRISCRDGTEVTFTPHTLTIVGSSPLEAAFFFYFNFWILHFIFMSLHSPD